MDTTQAFLLVTFIQALVIIALLLVIFSQGKQLGGTYPADVKQILGALAGLAVFFSAKTSTPLDDTIVQSVLLPVFKLLGVAIPTVTAPGPVTTPIPPGGTVTPETTVTPPASGSNSG